MNGYRASLLVSALLVAAPAMADDYTDLLDVLRAKGSLTSTEYSTLLAKHQRPSRVAHRRGLRNQRLEAATSTDIDDQAARARQDALAAAASAAAAEASVRRAELMQHDMMTSPDIVHAMPYKLGSGVTIRVGAVDLNFSGIVNGYYTYSSADSANNKVAGGLADASGFDSSSIRNGLLPGAFIVSASTTQDGVDLAAVFGVYPGINSSVGGPFGANSGGNATALGTAGVDFRKTYISAGDKTFGTVKIGRDLAIFGSDAILNDATLLSVGATGGNADPGNTSLGRIGYGYIYADFIPQITYISPIFGGFQATIGAFQPLNEVNFSGLSGSSVAHNTPLFEGKVTYDITAGAFTSRLWAGFMAQPQQGIVTQASSAPNNKDKFAVAGEAGAKVDIGPIGLTGYYYRGKGVGTTGKFLDGVSLDGQLRNSEGLYIQGSWKPIPKLKLVASYGESSLYRAAGDIDPALVRRNEAEVAAGYYSLTDWLTLVGEYARSSAKSHGPVSASSNAVTAGAILFY